MFEKNLHITFLLDFYGEVLGDRTRELLEMYYFDDMSLSEIADAVGITRQGVRGGIKKGEEELLTKELSGYSEYKNKVKYRLIPFIW